MVKKRLATVLLDGCSGCSMSLLEESERVLGLIDRLELVYSLGENTEPFPDGIDITLVEGAVTTGDDLARILTVREKTGLLISLGDCAVAGKSASVGNPFGVLPVLGLISPAPGIIGTGDMSEPAPEYRSTPRPVHTVVKVDYYIPGCAPDSELIHFVIGELVEGRQPDLTNWRRFSA